MFDLYDICVLYHQYLVQTIRGGAVKLKAQKSKANHSPSCWVPFVIAPSS
jgi:hypothetical protein